MVANAVTILSVTIHHEHQDSTVRDDISRKRKTEDLIVAAKQTALSHTHTLTCSGAPSDTSVYYNVLLGAE